MQASIYLKHTFVSCGFMYFCFLPCKVSTAAATHPNSKDSPTFTNGMIPGEHNFCLKLSFSTPCRACCREKSEMDHLQSTTNENACFSQRVEIENKPNQVTQPTVSQA